VPALTRLHRGHYIDSVATRHRCGTGSRWPGSMGAPILVGDLAAAEPSGQPTEFDCDRARTARR
jgi:hypothetical protein